MHSRCPVCAATAAARLDHQEDVPVFLNRLANTVEEARAAGRGTLDVVRCLVCGFVWNRAFEPDRVAYDGHYENDQSHSAAFRRHLEIIVQKVLGATTESQSIDLVEVGCGQGIFLQAVAARAGPRLRSAVGFDPTFRSDNCIRDPRIRIFKEYFNETTARLLDAAPSIVVSRHTIEHVADPIGFLAAIRRGTEGTKAHIFVETPDVAWILSRGAIEDLFYEHCSLFDADSLALALQAAGFASLKVETVFGGQYLWAEAVNSFAAAPVLKKPHAVRDKPNFTLARSVFVDEWRRRMAGVRPVVVWGAGAKGVTFCTIVDPDQSRIAAVIDINPGKQRRFVPLSGHPVMGPEALTALRPKLVVVMNPNYREEIASTLRSLNSDADLLVVGDDVKAPCSRELQILSIDGGYSDVREQK